MSHWKISALAFAACITHPAGAADAPAAPAGYNPDLALILSGTYSAQPTPAPEAAGFLRDPARERIPAGFSLGESELTLSANADDRYRGQLTAALAPEGTATVEEAYIQTRDLPAGLIVRAGRFYSGVGYLNSQHAHVWDFADAPLPYTTFLGGGYRDDGVQLRWLAPLDTFLELGAEAARGEHWPAAQAPNQGRGSAAGYVHLGDDLGANASYRLGASLLRTQAYERPASELAGADTFSGTTRVAIYDFVWKWAPDGRPTERQLKLQTEYLQRTERGEYVADPLGAASADAMSIRDSGRYTQLVYRFMPRWRIGVRDERLAQNHIAAGANQAVLEAPGHRPQRTSLMLDHNRSEMSRLRLQWSRDRSEPKPASAFYLQYQIAIGAHGAHQY